MGATCVEGEASPGHEASRPWRDGNNASSGYITGRIYEDHGKMYGTTHHVLHIISLASSFHRTHWRHRAIRPAGCGSPGTPSAQPEAINLVEPSQPQIGTFPKMRMQNEDMRTAAATLPHPPVLPAGTCSSGGWLTAGGCRLDRRCTLGSETPHCGACRQSYGIRV